MSKFIELAYLDGSKCFIKGISSVREERDYRLVTLQCGGSVDVINTVEEVAQKAREYEEMLLRDKFANNAMQAILNAITIPEGTNRYDQCAYNSEVADHAYRVADKMLKERSRDTSR